MPQTAHVARLDPAVKSMLPSFPSRRLRTVCVAPPLNSSAQRRAELSWIQTARARPAGADEEQLHATVGLDELRAHARVRWRPHAQPHRTQAPTTTAAAVE